MSWYDDTLKALNDNNGIILMLTAFGYLIFEKVKTKNAIKLDGLKFKAENIDVKTRDKENELYLIFSTFCLSDDFSEQKCIDTYEEIRSHIITNGLFLREGLSKVGSKFADYIIEDVANGFKDLQKEGDLLKEFKNLYRN